MVAILCAALFLVPFTVNAQQHGGFGPDSASSVAGEGSILSTIGQIGIDVLSAPFAVVAYILYSLAGLLVKVAWWLFNLSLQTMVVGMADLINSNAGINVGWAVMRDIANTAILFSLIYIGFMTILRASGAGWKKMLGLIIVAAILVNFSMVLTKVFIDVNNVMAVQIFKALNPSDVGGVCTDANTENDFVPGGCVDSGVGSVFMSMFAPASVMSGISALDTSSVFYASTLGTILCLIVIFVFLAGAFFLIGRFVKLAVAIVFSPLAFAALALPGMRGHWNKWVDVVVKESIFAPAFLLLLWLSASVMQAFTAAAGLDTASTANAIFPNEKETFGAAILEGNPEFSTIFIYFALTATFFIASLILARNFGVYGSKTAMNWFNTSRRRAVTWGVRRAAPIAREIETGKTQDRKWYNPNKYLLGKYSPYRAIGRASLVVPGVREGMQSVGKNYDRDLAKERAKFSTYSSMEVIRRMNGLLTPMQKVAMVQTLASRGDIALAEQEKKTDIIQSALRTMENTGVGQVKDDGAGKNAVVRQAPHLVTLAAKELKDQVAILEKVIGRQNADEVRKMSEVAFKDLKGKSPESYDAIFETMIKKYTSAQAGALFQESNTITDEFAEKLLKAAQNHNKLQPDEKKYRNNIDIVAQYLKYGGKDEEGKPKAINNTLGNWVKGNAGRKVLSAYWGNPDADIRADDEDEDEDADKTT